MQYNDMLPKLSGVNEIDALIDTHEPTFTYENPSKGNVITYSFESYKKLDGLPDATVYAVPVSQQDNIRQALQYVSNVTGINFSELHGGTNAPEIFFGYTYGNAPGAAATTYSQQFYDRDASGNVTDFSEYKDILFSKNDSRDTSDLSLGTYGYQAVLHEVGHALGLKHPFEGDIQLPGSYDNTSYTVMSYNQAQPPEGTGDNWVIYTSFDQEALAWLYGGQGLTGNNMYNLNYAMDQTSRHEASGGSPVSGTLLASAAATTDLSSFLAGAAAQADAYKLSLGGASPGFAFAQA